MNKTDFICLVADSINMTKKEAETVLNAVLDSVVIALKQDQKLVLTGFGTFEVHERAPKTGRNPQTGEEILIEGSNAPVFKAAKVFKDKLN